MAAAFLLLSLLGGPTLALLLTGGSPWQGQASAPRSGDDWSSLLATEKGFSRSLVLSVAQGRLTVDFSGTFEASGPLARRILEGGLEDEDALRSFIVAAFGLLELEGGAFHEATYSQPQWELVPQSQALHLKLQAWTPVGSTVSGELKRSPDAPPGLTRDEFRLNHAGGRRLSLLPVPDETSNEHALLARLSNPIPSIRFGVELPEGPAARTRLLLWNYGGVTAVPLLYDFLKGLGRALPFLLFLVFTREPVREEAERTRVLRQVTLTIIYFIVLLWLLTGLLKALYGWQQMRELSAWIETWGRDVWGVVPLTPLLPRAISALFPALIGVILPGFLMGRLQEDAVRTWRYTPARKSVLLGMAICATCMVVAVPVSSGFPGRHWLPVGMGALFLSWLLFVALLGAMGVRAFRSTTALVATATLGITVGLMVLPPHVAPTWKTAGWKGLDTALTTAVLLGLVMAYRHFTTAASGGPPPQLSTPARAGVVLGCVVLAYPVAMPQWTFSEHDLLSFVMTFSSFLGWFWLGGVLWLLHSHGRDSQRIAAMPRAVGLLALSATLYAYSSPISGGKLLTFLIGWLLLDRLVVLPSGRWESLERLLQVVVREREGLLQKILDLNALENAYVSTRQKDRERLNSGELKFDEYQKNNQEAWRQLTEARADAAVENRPAKELVLAFGPEPTAWGNGIRGATFGLLFALPWLLLAAWSIFEQPRSPHPYPLWVLAQGLLSTLLHWTIIGFLYGYFFPYIRGNSGLLKSFWIFLAIVVPFSVVALSNASTADHARAVGLWLTQTLIQIFSLGLFAFDHATLRKSGLRSWRLLFEVHDLPTVGLSLSSLFVAFGVALTTSLQSSAPRLVELALKFLLPSSSRLLTP